MNHLAHAYLSCGDQYLLTGNMLTDLVSKKEANAIHQDFQQGILLHRSIDKYMDTHEITSVAKRIIRKTQGKYASVSIDLLWDYYLVKNWKNYSGQQLELFYQEVYTMLQACFDKLPNQVVSRFQTMIDHDFLAKYEELETFSGVLKHMDKRAKFNSNFIGLVADIAAHSEELEQLFNVFFPQAVNHVSAFCDC